MWPFRRNSKSEPRPAPVSMGGFFSTDRAPLQLTPTQRFNMFPANNLPEQSAETFDSLGDGSTSIKTGNSDVGVPDVLAWWYASQGFIGYQMCALIAQHWLVDKAANMPARDAVRIGYDIRVEDVPEDMAGKISKRLRAVDKRMNINGSMREFIHMGRVYGIRVAIFKVDSTDPEYYEKPFNLDGVTPGSYRGIAQVDPMWMVPELTTAALAEPDSLAFYEPQYYRIGKQRYHRSHLAIYIPYPVPDLLRPNYQWGGASLPQRIYERVYAAERTANEAPQLTMTKRLTVLKVNIETFFANIKDNLARLADWLSLRDNYGAYVTDKDNEDVTQIDTSLTDVDTVIMTQFQLVAAIAEVPGTKLMGTQVKGFNSTGEYEEATYRESLESIQTNDLTPLLERHHQLAMRSEVAPSLGIQPVETTAVWLPLDSPTATEWADINLKKAQTDQIYVECQAIDGEDIRARLKSDKNSDYTELADIVDQDIVHDQQQSSGIVPKEQQ